MKRRTNQPIKLSGANVPSAISGFGKITHLRQLSYLSYLSLVLLVLSFVFVPYLVVEASAESVNTELAWGTTFLELSTGDDVEFNGGDPITPTAATGDSRGTMAVAGKTITVNTSAKHYSVYLSMSEDSTDASLHHATVSSLAINPVSASWDTPSRLTGNTWGYAVPNTTSPTNETTWTDPLVPEYPAFASAYTTGLLLYSTPDVNHTYSASFSPVPLSSNPQMIYKDDTTNIYGFGTYELDGASYIGDSNNNFGVYYGVMVNTDLLAGEYSNELVYTAFASTTALDEVSNNIGVDKHYVVAGHELTLSFDLTASVASIATDKTKAYVVPHADTVADNYAVGSTLTANKSSYGLCDYVSGNFVSGAGSTYTCTLPEGTLGSSYDLWLEIEDYHYNYITKLEDADDPGNYIGAIRFAGLSYDSDDNGTADSYIVYMQEMTTSICQKTNIWNNETGSNARILYATGSLAPGGSLVGTQVIDETDPATIAKIDTNHDGIISDAEILEANAAINVGTFALVDERDDKTYLVRHLADGNCWMVQNLDLDLATSGTLTPADTNITTNWDPYASTQTKINTTYATELANNNLSADFTGLSTLLLGQAQPAQYQSQTQTGYWWGSKVSDDGNFTPLASVTNNANAEIPRSYTYESDVFYNWYAATAETGTYAMTSGNAAGSICPKGWQLPVNEGDKSWYKLLQDDDYYDIMDNGGAQSMSQIPLSFASVGTYYWSDGDFYYRSTGGYSWSSTAYLEFYVSHLSVNAVTGGVDSQNHSRKINGFSVRCVAQ